MYLVRNLSGLNTAVMTCSGSAMGLTWGDMCDVFIAFNSCLSAKMAGITCLTAHPARWGGLRSPGVRGVLSLAASVAVPVLYGGGNCRGKAGRNLSFAREGKNPPAPLRKPRF